MTMPPKLTRPAGHDDSVFVLNISGGKDSAAGACAMIEAGIPCRYVAADTAWEANKPGVAVWLEYLATIERVLRIRIERVGVPGGMVAVARKKAGFPFRRGRWCTETLKLEPIRAHLDAIREAEQTDTVSVLGVRAEESDARAAMPEFEYAADWGGYIWRPLHRWTIADVLAIHHRHGLPVNPLYQLGFERVGCMPCIMSGRKDIRLLARHFPERVAEIEALEAEFTVERARRNATGEGEFKHPVATFFQSKRKGEVLPIRDAVAWARAERGGRQLPLIDDAPDTGCFRWGLCDAPSTTTADE